MIWVVYRGSAGMADRLSMLSWILRLAIETHTLRICVDWRDQDWTGGDPRIDFDTLFELRGVPTISLAEVLEAMRTRPLRVHPPWMTAAILATPPTEAERERCGNTLPHILSPDCKHLSTNVDIVVCHNKSWRNWCRNTLVHCLRIRTNVWEMLLRSGLERFVRELRKPRQMVVHLRCTDRSLSGQPLSGVHALLYATRRLRPEWKYWVIGDSPDAIALWIKHRGAQSEVAFPTLPTRRIHAPPGRGIHLLTEAETGVPRFEVLCDTLREFVVLCLGARHGIATTASASFFAHLAQIIGPRIVCMAQQSECASWSSRDGKGSATA